MLLGLGTVGRVKGVFVVWWGEDGAEGGAGMGDQWSDLV